MSETQVNSVLAITTFMLALTLIPCAALSEKIGRRPVMLAGLAVLPLLSVLMANTTTFSMLVFYRGLVGVALAGYAAVAVAYMAEELSPSAFKLALGGYISANSIGGIAGRISGGLLNDWFGWSTAVWILAVFSLLSVIFIARCLPKQRHFVPVNGGMKTIHRQLVMHARNAQLLPAILIGGFNFAIFVNLYSVMSFRLVGAPFYLPVGYASLIFLCYLAGTITSKFSGYWLIVGRTSTGMLLGAIVSAMGMLVAAKDNIAYMLLGLLLVSAGAFFIHSLAYSWVGEKAQQGKATANALYLVSYYVGGSLGGYLLLSAWQQYQWTGVMAAGGILYIVLIIAISKVRQQEEHVALEAVSN